MGAMGRGWLHSLEWGLATHHELRRPYLGLPVNRASAATRTVMVLAAAAGLCGGNLLLGFRGAEGYWGFVRLFLLDLGAIGLISIATKRLAIGVTLGAALSLLPFLYYMLPGSDAAGRAWASLLVLGRLGFLVCLTALSWLYEPRDLWTKIACWSVCLPAAALALLAILG